MSNKCDQNQGDAEELRSQNPEDIEVDYEAANERSENFAFTVKENFGGFFHSTIFNVFFFALTV